MWVSSYFFSVFSIVINVKKWVINNFMTLYNDMVIKIIPHYACECVQMACFFPAENRGATQLHSLSAFYNDHCFPKPILMLCRTIKIPLFPAHKYMNYIHLKSYELCKFNSYGLYVLFHAFFLLSFFYFLLMKSRI